MANPVGEIIWPEIPGIRAERTVLVRWQRPDGDVVRHGDILALVEADDALVEIAAEWAGMLRHVVKTGETVLVGKSSGMSSQTPWYGPRHREGPSDASPYIW